MSTEIISDERHLVRGGTPSSRSTRLSDIMRGAGWEEDRIAKFAYSVADVHVDTFLTNFSIDYRGVHTLIADKMLPIVKVEKASNIYPVWSRADANKIIEAYVGPSDFPAEVTQSFSNSNYKCQPRSLWARVPNDVLANADGPLDLLGQASRDVRGALDLSREKRVADLVMTASNYSQVQTLTGNNQWDAAANVATGDPVKDILNGLNKSAVPPNRMGFSKKVWTAFRQHPKVLASVSGIALSGAVQARLATEAQIAALFGLDVSIGDAKYRSSADGATEVYTYVWGAGCALLYEEDGIGINTKSWGKTFRHLEMQFSSIYDQRPGVTGVTYTKGAHSDSETVTAKDMGSLIDTTIANANE